MLEAPSTSFPIGTVKPRAKKTAINIEKNAVNPKTLIILDNNETGLFDLHKELQSEKVKVLILNIPEHVKTASPEAPLGGSLNPPVTAPRADLRTCGHLS